MVEWLDKETLFSLRFALRNALKLSATIRRLRRDIGDGEYDIMTRSIAEHMRLSNWSLRKGEPSPPPKTPPDWSPHSGET
jgi:hypothetical protein